jgi:hypothetical protein
VHGPWAQMLRAVVYPVRKEFPRMLMGLDEQALFEWYVTEGPGASG